VLEQVARHGAEWQKAAADADARAMKIAASPVALTYKTTDKTHTVDFKGYAYTRTPSDVSGILMTHYDETKPQVWTVPLRDEVVVDLTVNAPGAGYIVPAAHAKMVAAKLAQHGIGFRTLAGGQDKLDVETFRADKATFAPGSFESRQRLAVRGAWKAEPRAVGKGALFVPVAQPKARLVMAMFEPQAPDSLLAWGAFNNAFERKEYMEEYVAEDVAREQMAADPALAVQFKKMVDGDPAFAKDARARLEFFARRHASWDERFNLYPVMRTDVVPK
jgi:hypothetical protein